MTCPDLGTWRAWLDDRRAGALEEHRAGCAHCRAIVGELEAQAAHAAAALGALAPSALPSGPAVRLAWARLGAPSADAVSAAPRGVGRRVPASGCGGAPGGQPVATRAVRPVGAYATAPSRRGGLARWRLAGVGIAAALLVSAIATVPYAQTAAAGFLAQFRSKSFVAVPVDESQGRRVFGYLKELGVVQEPRDRRPERVGSLDEASRRVGFPITLPNPATLPAGLSAPTYEVFPATDLRFTVQKAKVQEYLRRVGRPNHPFEDRYDGATLVVRLPAAALLNYRGPDKDRNILIGQSGEVTAEVEGRVSLDELRTYVLGLPGLPEDAVREMRALQNWDRALPVPVPTGVAWQNTTIGGNPALMLADGTGLASGVIWNRNGRIYGVAGSIAKADLLRLANGIP